MTWVPDRVGCSVFLNNRYQDPAAGVFVSVDPLVGQTGHPYLYANGNPTTLSDPSGLCSVGGGNANEVGYAEALSACSLGKSVAQSTTMSDHDRLVYTLLRIWNEKLGFEKRVDDYQRRVADAGGSSLYYNWSPESHERMVNERAMDRFVESAAEQYPELFPEKDKGLFDGCGWKCAVATITTGILAGGTAGAVCVFTVGIGCGAATAAAVGTTSVVYEATSNPDADGGDLVCAFFFGPSNSNANVVAIVASGGLNAATQGTVSAVKGVVQDVALDEVGGFVCQ